MTRPPSDMVPDTLHELRARLLEAEETIAAIRNGDVDAVVVGGGGPAVYTLESGDRPYRRLIEQIGEGALTMSPDGMILYCNRRLAELAGLPQEHVTGRLLHHFIAEPEQAEAVRLFQRGSGRREFTFRGIGGTSLPVILSVSELRQDPGGTRCAVLTDLSEQRRAGEALRRAHDTLLAEIAGRERTETMLRQAQKMEAVGQLTGGIAHDFNNLLQAITGNLEIMQHRLAAGRGDGLQRSADAAMVAARRAATLTQRLLSFARRQPLDPKPVDANQLLAAMADMLGSTLGRETAFGMELAEAPWLTLCDPNQLDSAVLNLAINARDAMPRGGRFTLATANATVGDANGDVPPGDYMVLSATDTGTGMSADVAARAFEPFFTTKPTGQGTGLGLSMLYGFVSQSSGHVRIRSMPGQGTTVALYLPRHREQPAAGPRRGQISRTDAAALTVLVVEDEAAVRRLLVEVVQQLGYRTIEADDGPSGLRVLQSGAGIDLLLTDVGLPGLDGRELAIAARVDRPHLKVLFATGYAYGATLGRGAPLEPGMEIVTKPFALDTLSAKIRAMVES